MRTNSCDRNPSTPRTRRVATILAWFALSLMLLIARPARAQTWDSKPTPFTSGLQILLTDGTVIVQEYLTPNWWKLTPDAFGSYSNGTWSQIASMPTIDGTPYAPLYYASAVLADGRVVAFGGEYIGGFPADSNNGCIYDPIANTWTALDGPGWDNIGDASCAVLPDGMFVLQDPFGLDAAILDPVSLTWVVAGSAGKNDINSEEGWTLLPDGTLLTVDTESGTDSERYDPEAGAWITAGSTLLPLPAAEPGFVPEVGPQVLRPDGTVICFGASGFNAVYHVGYNFWSIGPTFPFPLDCADAPACLLTDGNVLVAASPGLYNAPTSFFEFDGSRLKPVPDPNFNADSSSSFFYTMLMLPTGQVMISYFNNEVEFYNAKGGPKDAWRPTISSYPTTVATGGTYTIFGTQLNGLSQCSAYGDDNSNATNYPLVRITNHATGHVIFFRTHDHSTMAVATGSMPVSTHFDVPATAELGAADLVVVTNGIASLPVTITVMRAPTAFGQTDSVLENNPLQITLSGSDTNVPPLTPLTFAIAAPPIHGTLGALNASTGVVTYTPNAGYLGPDGFTFTVKDSAGLVSAPAGVTLNVVVGTPTATAQTVSVAHNTAKAITLTGTDTNIPARKLTFAIATTPKHGTLGVLNTASGAVTYTPVNNFQGTDSFTFTVTNGTYKSAPATVTLSVAPGVPTAKAQAVAVIHNTAKAITLTGTDTDAPALPLTYSIATAPTHGTLGPLNFTTGAVIYTPAANYHGTDSFTFTVKNGVNTSLPATVTLTVAVGAPTAIAQSVSVAHNTAKVITLTGADADVPGLTLTYAIAVAPSHGTLGVLNTATGAVTYTPSANYHGNDTFTFTVSNGTTKSAAAAVSISVAAGTPTATAQSVSVSHNTATAITLAGVDVEVPALTLTFAIATSPTHGTLSGFQAGTGKVTYTPTAGYTGPDSFTFTVTNGINKSAAAAVTLTVK